MAIAFDDSQEGLKVPPHSIDAERSVLGGLMLDAQAWDNISAILTAEEFYRSEHRPIFRAMEWLVKLEDLLVEAFTAPQIQLLLRRLPQGRRAGSDPGDSSRYNLLRRSG